MPRSRKKTPLTDTPINVNESTTNANDPPVTEVKPTTRRSPYLSLAEKRKWLAQILRDTSGQHQGFEISMGDKFKALSEDNKLAGHPGDKEEENTPKNKEEHIIPELLKSLLETVRPPQQQHFSRHEDKG